MENFNSVILIEDTITFLKWIISSDEIPEITKNSSQALLNSWEHLTSSKTVNTDRG